MPRLMQGVAKSFREIFGELAPGGRGELVMQKRNRSEQQQADEMEGEELEAQPVDAMSEKYSGVKVKVGPAQQLTGACFCLPQSAVLHHTSCSN